MSETLYRKYRPKKFKEVLGQDHVVEALENAIKSDTVSHAYIFAGGRGIGKTSIARIFADALDTKDEDLYEIDAASNRGIDDIREIRQSVSTLPFRSRFKIYIIDEVHMLTKEAWNALLKTLEEPPSHVLFIMATTEYEKIPDTIISRSEVHVFKLPTIEILKKSLQNISKKEGLDIDSEALELIALLADGSFRDSLGILQKVIHSVQNEKITLSDVEKATGAPSIILVSNFLEALRDKDVEKGLKVLETLEEKNSDVKLFLKIYIERIRDILKLRLLGDKKESILGKYTKDHGEFLINLSKESKHINSDVLKKLLEASFQIDKSFVKTLPLEIFFIDILESK